MSADITQLASKIRLLLMDVDGVLTDGKLYNVPGPDGKMAETKGFDSQDGIALQWMARVGIATGLISGRVSPATVERATQCKFKYVYQGHTEKIPILEEILADAKTRARRGGLHRRRFHRRGGDAPRRLRDRHRQRAAGNEADRALRHRRRPAARERSAKSSNCCSKRRASGTEF